MSRGEDVLAEVCERHGVEPRLAMSRLKGRRYAAVRGETYFVLHERERWSYTEIARWAQRDRATIIEAIQRFVRTVCA